MDYNARFYSPHLGRFVSADTVVPNPMNAKSYDRYSYVAGNPIKYNDPSGHRYVCGAYDLDPSCEAEGGQDDPDEIGEEADTDGNGGITGLTASGQEAYNLYQELVRLTNGQFTLEDFIRLIFERELNGWGGDKALEDLMQEAAARNYWKWAEDEFGEHTLNTLFNWLGGHNHVVDSIGADLSGGKKTLDMIIGNLRDYAYNEDAAREIAKTLLDVPDEWKVFNPDAPYSFGFCEENGNCMINVNKRADFENIAYSTPLNADGTYRYSTAMEDFYFISKNNSDPYSYSYIVTFNQGNYWASP